MADAEELAAALLHEGWEEPPRALVITEDRWHSQRARQSLLDALYGVASSPVSHTTVDTIHLHNGARVRFMSAASPERIRGMTIDLVWWVGRWEDSPLRLGALRGSVDIQMARGQTGSYRGPREWR